MKGAFQSPVISASFFILLFEVAEDTSLRRVFILTPRSPSKACQHTKKMNCGDALKQGGSLPHMALVER